MFSSFLSLLIRIPIYLFFLWLSFFILMPRIESQFLAMILLMPLASLAIFLDIFLTAKIQRRKVEEVISRRIIAVDNLLASEEDKISNRRRLETRDVEALPEKRALLENPNQDKHEQ